MGSALDGSVGVEQGQLFQVKDVVPSGGCAFGHVTYEEELRIKERQVSDALTRLGGLKEVPCGLSLAWASPSDTGTRAHFPTA